MGPGGGGAAFSGGVSNLGNTLGATGLTGTQLVFAGIGNLTLSQATDLNGGTITISGGTAAGAGFSLGVSGGNTAGDTGATGTRVVLAGGNGITLSQATDANGGSITVSGITQSAQTQNLFDLTIDGNTAGAPQLVSSGTLTLAGGANITLSQNGNAITVVGAAGGAETQTFVGGIAGSNTTYTSGTVTITGVGGGVTVSSNTGQRIDISVAAPVAQTGTQFSAGISGGNTSGHSGTVAGRVVFVGGNNITLSGSTNGASETITVSAFNQTTQTQNLHNVTLSGNTAGAMAQISSGTMTLAGGNNITLSQAGNAITISGANVGGAQTGISGIAASNTTYTSGSVTFTGVGGGVTVSSNTGQRVDISVAAPVAQTNQAGSLFAVGNTTSSSSGTYDARTLSLRGDGIISIAATNSGFRISAVAQTGISSIVASDATYTSGSVQFTGSGIVTVRSSANQRVVIDASQSVQTQNMVAVTLSGNTSGAQALISSGTMTLAGGNNITVSQNGNAVTISGANVGGAQTGISGIANSQTTYTSGTVSMSELGAITIRSTTGNQYQFSVNPQTGTQFSAGLSNIGNTAGDTVTVAGRVILAGGNGITLSGSSNGVSQTITISGITQSVQTQSLFSAGVSTGGNTAGDTGVTGTRLVFVGTNNITLSQATAAAGGTVTISGPTTVAQTNQAGSVYAVGNTTSSSSGTYDARTLSIRGDGIISVAATNSGWRISATESVQTQNLHNVTLSGNTAGAMAQISSGTMTLAGGNNITLSQAGNAVTISGGAGGAFSAGVSNIGNTAGDTGVSGTRMVLAGIGEVTLSQSTNANGNTISISAPVQSTQPGVQHFVVSNTTFSSGTVSISGFGDVTVNTAANIIRISAPVQTAQTGISGIANSQTTYTSGTVSLSELGAITIRSTTGNQYQFSVNAQTGTQFSAGISNIGNTAGDTGTVAGRVVLAGGNGITLSGSTNGVSETITISGITQSVQTQNVHNVTLSGNTAGAMAHISSGTMTLAGGNNITLSQAGNAVTISGGAGGAFSGGFSTAGNTAGDTGFVTGRLALVGSNGITLSGSTNAGSQTITISGITQSVESQSIGASNLGNTLGTSGVASGGQVRAVIIGTSNITVSQSVNGASATLSLLGQPSFSAGLSTGGNTQGNTGISGTRLVLVGTNNITLSQNTDANGATISISGQSPAGGAFSGGASNLGNTAGATGISGTQMVLVGSGVMSLSQTTGANGNTVSILAPPQSVISAVAPLSTSTNGSTISILAPATSSLVGASGISISTNGSTISIGQINRSEFYPYNEAPMVTGQQGDGTLHIQPQPFPNLQHDRMLIGMQISNATNSSGQLTLSAYAGLYTKNANTLSLVASISTSTNFTGSGTQGIYSSYGGPKWMSIPWTQTVTAGDYYVAIGVRSATANPGGAGHIVSQLLHSKFTNSAWSGVIGQATNASDQHQLGLGVFSITTAGVPASIAFTDLRGSGSIVLRAPVFQLRSGT